MFIVDTVRAADLPEVMRISAASLSEHYDDAFFMAMKDLAGDTFVVARHLATDDVAGFAIAVRQTPHEARLLLLATAPRHRRTGLGGRLLREIEMRLRRHGVMGFELEVRQDNMDALMFYRRKGFDLTRSIRGFYADGASAVVMSKGL